MPLDTIDYLPINNNLLVVVDSRLLFEPDRFKKRQSAGLFDVVATSLYPGTVDWTSGTLTGLLVPNPAAKDASDSVPVIPGFSTSFLSLVPAIIDIFY